MQHRISFVCWGNPCKVGDLIEAMLAFQVTHDYVTTGACPAASRGVITSKLKLCSKALSFFKGRGIGYVFSLPLSQKNETATLPSPPQLFLGASRSITASPPPLSGNWRRREASGLLVPAERSWQWEQANGLLLLRSSSFPNA